MRNFVAMLLFIAVLFLSSNKTQAQSPDFLWAEQAGGTGFGVTGADVGFSIATDGSGNSFVTGEFFGTATFGNTTLSSDGSSDIFITKLDDGGNFLWVTQIQRPSLFGEETSITTDELGNVFVTGSFFGTATIGDTTLDGFGIFITKLDGDGNFLWVTKADGTSTAADVGITTDGSGNCIVTGSFTNMATFGDTTLTNVGPSNTPDIFIAKYDGDGNFLWAAQAGGGAFSGFGDIGTGIATDGSGNINVTGLFAGTAVFGDTLLSAFGGSNDIDIFVAKYDSDGNFQWAAQAGSGGLDFATGIVVDDSDNSIVTGPFLFDATFGNITLTGPGVFITKLDVNGNFLWAVNSNAFSDVGIAIDGSGNSIVTGAFESTRTFGNTTLTSVGEEDIFIAKLDVDGNFLWAVQAGGGSSDNGLGIASNNSGNVFVTGFFGGVATFGNTTLISAGDRDIFITKLSPGVTGIEEEFALPGSFNLWQNYPNPFNPSTSIQYSIPSESFVELKVYDVLGKEVATLVNEQQQAGVYRADFIADNLPSGMYFARITANEFTQVVKMILLK